jgi:hypothetical protein
MEEEIQACIEDVEACFPSIHGKALIRVVATKTTCEHGGWKVEFGIVRNLLVTVGVDVQRHHRGLPRLPNHPCDILKEEIGKVQHACLTHLGGTAYIKPGPDQGHHRTAIIEVLNCNLLKRTPQEFTIATLAGATENEPLPFGTILLGISQWRNAQLVRLPAKAVKGIILHPGTHRVLRVIRSSAALNQLKLNISTEWSWSWPWGNRTIITLATDQDTKTGESSFVEIRRHGRQFRIVKSALTKEANMDDSDHYIQVP